MYFAQFPGIPTDRHRGMTVGRRPGNSRSIVRCGRQPSWAVREHECLTMRRVVNIGRTGGLMCRARLLLRPQRGPSGERRPTEIDTSATHRVTGVTNGST